jgi:Fur family ferric uptake transcriptional regulator
MTRQRQVILEELRKVSSHPTADEVYEMVRRRLPRVSLGTVYRNLEMLSERGMIQRLDVGGTRRRYDGNVGDHYHVRCVSCGRVEDVSVEPAAGVENAVRGVSDYEILGHRLEFIGLCPQCKKDRPAASATSGCVEDTTDSAGEP